MEREQHLTFCKACNLQQFDSKKGIVCRLTGEYADFEESCENYSENETQKAIMLNKTMERELMNNIADSMKRTTNWILDTIFYFIFLFIVFSMALGIVINYYPPGFYYFQEMSPAVYMLLATLIYVIYFTALETLSGKSIAKFITKTKVVTIDGAQPDFKAILIRSLCRLIPFEALTFIISESKGVHDIWSKTMVINDK